jgi:hypothetical protein
MRIALVGAGGKMGTRLRNNLLRHPAEYSLAFCEKGEAGVGRLREQGLAVTPPEQALAGADAAILAVPDAGLRAVSAQLVPLMKPRSCVVMLDPAAAAAGEVTLRDDLTFVVCHPCHPPLFGEQPTPEARRDFFGGVAARQDIVIALLQGTEGWFAEAETLCRRMFAPVEKVHRITVEQMAILEPAMAEVVAASAAVLMREALEEAVQAGVPREAATAFMLGHAQIPLAIAFGAISSPFSDAARIAIRYGKRHVIQPDWRKVFKRENVLEAIREMLHPEGTP